MLRTNDQDRAPMTYDVHPTYGYQVDWRITGDEYDIRLVAYRHQAQHIFNAFVRGRKRVSLYSWGYLTIVDNARGWRKESRPIICPDCQGGRPITTQSGAVALQNMRTVMAECPLCKTSGHIEIA